MKSVFLTILLIVLIDNSLSAQPIDASAKADFRHILKLISQDKSVELSRLVHYPIRMQNPLPNIATSREFIKQYPILFDEAFKTKIKHYNDTVIFFKGGNYYGLVGGVFMGDLWMNPDGKLIGINYQSAKLIGLRDQLTKKIQSQIYPGINTWDENVLVAKSINLLIRIDETAEGLRYVSWSKNRPTSEKPNLVLYNGIAEAQGTMGGWTYTFKNGDWTYIVDDVKMCADDSPQDCGLFLRLEFKGVGKSSIKLKEIK